MRAGAAFSAIVIALGLAGCSGPGGSGDLSTAAANDSATVVYDEQFHFIRPVKCDPFVYDGQIDGEHGIAQYTVRMRPGGSQITLLYKFAPGAFPVQELAYVGPAKEPVLTVQLNANAIQVLNAAQQVALQVPGYLTSALGEEPRKLDALGADAGSTESGASGADDGVSAQDDEDALAAMQCDIPENLVNADAATTPAFFLDEQQAVIPDSGGLTGYSQDSAPLFAWTNADGGAPAGTVFDALDSLRCLDPTDEDDQVFRWSCGP